jgi:hypothetical protein
MAELDGGRILRLADLALKTPPATITAVSCRRSAGGIHDFYSEGDYWWPSPYGPDLPYVRRDGLINPENFDEHRRLLIEMSSVVAALTAAWLVSRDLKYARQAIKHLRAWFIDDETRMNPSLNFAQAIYGRVTGRGIGIVDTIHLVEVALAIESLSDCPILEAHQFQLIQIWFADYVEWLTTHPYGIEEQNERNNHSSCWVMQVAAFARLIGRVDLMELCGTKFKTILVPTQMARNGSFPLELARTRPYNYSLFNLELMAGICQLLSREHNDLWHFELLDGRGMKLALEHMIPYIRDKHSWPLANDVMYHDEWPKRHNSLLFGGLALHIPEAIDLWRTLEADSVVFEVNRNYFIRQPIIWLLKK